MHARPHRISRQLWPQTCAVFCAHLSPAPLPLVTFGPFVTLRSANFFQPLPFPTTQHGTWKLLQSTRTLKPSDVLFLWLPICSLDLTVCIRDLLPTQELHVFSYLGALFKAWEILLWVPRSSLTLHIPEASLSFCQSYTMSILYWSKGSGWSPREWKRWCSNTPLKSQCSLMGSWGLFTPGN